MKLATALVAAVLPIGAQEVVTLPAGNPRPEAAHWTSAGTFDSNLHANVLKLMELTGDRTRLQQALPKLLSDARDKILKTYPNVNPAFGDEWEKRMAAKLTVDDFLDVAARVYEKHFSNDEILQFIDVMNAKKEGKPVKASAQLQQKLAAEMPAMMGEMVGGATELAVRVGNRVGSEIGREHPEYLLRPNAGSTGR